MGWEPSADRPGTAAPPSHPLAVGRVTPFVYTQATKGEAAYGLLGATNDRRLSVYAESADD